jgi:hypothetical protein
MPIHFFNGNIAHCKTGGTRELPFEASRCQVITPFTKGGAMPRWSRCMLLLGMALLAPLAAAAECAIEGDGGDADLNRLKNRRAVPPSYQEMSVPQFMRQHDPNLETPKRRDKFSDEQNNYIAPREAKAVALVGFMLGAKRRGLESSNCHEPDLRDFHVWIGPEKPGSADDAKTMREDAVVVEPTPYFRQKHPSWTLKALLQLAKSGTKVRISGWVMYDPERPDELEKTRRTLWEIYPVHRIEVWTGGQWREL